MSANAATFLRPLLAVLLVTAPAPALAHGAAHPRHAELRVRQDSLEITFFLELPGPEAANVRRLFDRNRDGRLIGGERDQLTTFLRLRARGGFRVRLGSGPLELVEVDRKLDGVDPSGPAEPLLVRLRVRTTWPADDVVKLRVRDDGDTLGHLPVAVLGERVEVRMALARLQRRGEADVYDLPAHREVEVTITRRE